MKKIKIRLNPDAELVAELKEAIKACDGHCCCESVKTPENKCMCKPFRDQIKAGKSGFCHCTLYEAYEVDE